MPYKTYLFKTWAFTIGLCLGPNTVFAQSACGEKIPALGIYEPISQYSLGLAVVLMIVGIIFEASMAFVYYK